MGLVQPVNEFTVGRYGTCGCTDGFNKSHTEKKQRMRTLKHTNAMSRTCLSKQVGPGLRKPPHLHSNVHESCEIMAVNVHKITLKGPRWRTGTRKRWESRKHTNAMSRTCCTNKSDQGTENLPNCILIYMYHDCYTRIQGPEAYMME